MASWGPCRRFFTGISLPFTLSLSKGAGGIKSASTGSARTAVTSPQQLTLSLAKRLFILALLLLPVLAFGSDMAELETDHALTFDFPTPHTKWAKPYVKGKIRVLFFCDGRSLDPRECVELMERFDIEAESVFLSNVGETDKTHWHGGDLGERRMLRLIEQRWDCFVFIGISPAGLPQLPKELLLRAVKAGAGLVLSGTAGEAPAGSMAAGRPFFLARRDVERAFTLGRGRGVRLPAQPQIPYGEGWQVSYDYWQERFGRAVLWAAGKEPAVNISLQGPLSPDGETPQRFMRGKPLPVVVRLVGTPLSQGDLTLEPILRSPGRPPLQLPLKNLSGPVVQLTVPVLAEGEWHLDLRLVSAAGVESWRTVPFEVSSDRSVSAVLLDNDHGEVGAKVSGKVLLSGKTEPGEMLRIQLLDQRRRELVREDVPVTGDAVSFQFPGHKWLPMLVTVEARLYREGAELSRSYRYYHVVKRKHGEFNFVIWGEPKGTLAPYAEQSLAEQGVTVQYDWLGPRDPAGAFDISWVSHTTHMPGKKNPDGTMWPFCWNDEKALSRQLAAIAPKSSAERGAFAYSLGDENKTLGSCLSPHCADAYRSFLKESYGSIGALNRSWGTRFHEWREVGLSVAGDDLEENSKRFGNYPRWFDRQAYRSWNYLQLCKKHLDSYRRLDPEGKTGFDGAAGFATGDDVDLIIRSMDFWVPYQGQADEVIRSVAPREFVRSNWIGGRDKTPGPLLQKYWRLVNMGADSIWWWMWSCIGDLHGFLAPDLRPFPEIVEVLKDTRPVREGLGDLLIRSQMQDDGIAVLYSYPSVFATQVEDGPGFGGYEKAHRDLTGFIRRCGFQFRYVTDRMLRLGEVDLSRYRILFLPRAEALGEVEARAVKNFVAGGGTVVADLRPGLYDDHVRRRAFGILDELFGIKGNGRKKARWVEIDPLMGKSSIVDPGVLLKGGKAARTAGGMPLANTCKFGKGRAILLNCGTEALPEVISSLGGAKAFWGTEPMVRVTPTGGKGAFDLETTRWKNGESEIVSLFKKGGGEEGVTVSLSGKKYVYDLRGGKQHGPCDSFQTSLVPDRASFFLLTDRPLSELEMRLAAKDVGRGSVVRGEISVPDAQGLVGVKLRVKSCDRYLPWHDQVMVVGKVPVPVELPIAYNDPAGEYRLVVKEVFSGREWEFPITVK